MSPHTNIPSIFVLQSSLALMYPNSFVSIMSLHMSDTGTLPIATNNPLISSVVFSLVSTSSTIMFSNLSSPFTDTTLEFNINETFFLSFNFSKFIELKLNSFLLYTI